MPGQWLDKKRRIAEARKSFERLVRIRDGEILERKVIGKNKDGEPITADVVASIRDQIVCNDKIMNRALSACRKLKAKITGSIRRAYSSMFWNR